MSKKIDRRAWVAHAAVGRYLSSGAYEFFVLLRKTNRPDLVTLGRYYTASAV
jgi:hypothetical protein